MENIWPNFHLDTENRILLCFWHRNQIIHWRNWRAALNSKVVSRLVHRRRFIGHFIFPTAKLMFWHCIFHSLSFVASNINLLHLFASKHCIHSDILWAHIGKLTHVPHKSFWTHLIQSIFGGVTKSESFGRICHKVRWPWPWPYIKEQPSPRGPETTIKIWDPRTRCWFLLLPTSEPQLDENQGSAAKSGIKFAIFSVMFNEVEREREIAGIWIWKRWSTQRSSCRPSIGAKEMFFLFKRNICIFQKILVPVRYIFVPVR